MWKGVAHVCRRGQAGLSVGLEYVHCPIFIHNVVWNQHTCITVYLLMFFRPVAGLIFNPMVSIAIVINLPESNRSVVIIHVRLGLANCTDYI